MVTVVHVPEDIEPGQNSLFLVGPTPRAETGGESWRPAMIECLREEGFGGLVYVPERVGDQWATNYNDQVEWELKYLHSCGLIVAWVPRDLVAFPAFTTNVEFGMFVKSGRLVYGRPDGAPKTRYLDAVYRKFVGEDPVDNMPELAHLCVERVNG